MRFSKLLLILLALSVPAASLNGCRKKEKIDLSGVHESSSQETMAPETGTAGIVIETSSAAPADLPESSDSADSSGSTQTKNITTKTNTYTSGKVTITYPSVLNMADTKKAAAIDELLKKNALAVLEAKEIKDRTDSLDIKCKVLAADRNRITVTYTGTMTKEGAAYPVNLFYSNTVDVSTGKNLGFSKFADPYTMAGYVLSEDCTFSDASPELSAQLMKAKNETSLEAYTALFQKADFTSSAFAESFSYEYEGAFYFTIPVSHALGDYATVVYTFDTK